MGVDDVTEEEEYNKVEDMTPFAVVVDTSILLAEEEAPYARHDHNEGTLSYFLCNELIYWAIK